MAYGYCYVILIIQQEKYFNDKGEGLMGMPELIYTAITRAKTNLFILNMGNRKFDVFFMTQTY